MKKILSILIMMVFTSIMIFGNSIVVTNPDSSTVLLKGQVLKITWNKIGKQIAFVKIRLFNSKGDQKILGIVERAPNSGMFRWRYTGNVPDGQYIIRIKTKDDKVTGNSKVFRIGKKGSLPPPPPPPPTPGKKLLSLTYPNGGETLSKNYSNSITWKAENLTGNITIELWKGNRKYGTIANNIPAGKTTYKWTTGNTFGNSQAQGGVDYRIKLTGNGLDDISDKYFTISDIPGIVSNVNNIGNTIHTFKNPPPNTVTIAIPPVVEEVKVWSRDPKLRGQVKWGESFDIKILLKNISNSLDKRDWNIKAYLDGKLFFTDVVKNSVYPRMPGKSWGVFMSNASTERLPNKSGFHVLKVVLGNSSKSTMLGIIKKDFITYPKINQFNIWNNECSCWSDKGKYKPGTKFKVKYEVLSTEKITIIDANTNKVLSTFKPGINGKGELTLTAVRTGFIKLQVTSISNNYEEAKVYLISSKPLQISEKFLTFEIWRSGNALKTKGMVQGYRSVKLVEPNGRILKGISTNDWKSSRLDWEFLGAAFPIKLTLKVTYLDYSQENITRTIK